MFRPVGTIALLTSSKGHPAPTSRDLSRDIFTDLVEASHRDLYASSRAEFRIGRVATTFYLIES